MMVLQTKLKEEEIVEGGTKAGVVLNLVKITMIS